MAKNISCLLLLVVFMSGCHKDVADTAPASTCGFTRYRYSLNTPYDMGEMEDRYLVVTFENRFLEADVRKFIGSIGYFDPQHKYLLYTDSGRGGIAGLRFKTPKTCEEITGIIDDLLRYSIVSSAHYAMKTSDCLSPIYMPMGNLCVTSYSNFFYVKVYDPAKLDGLYKMIAETKTELVRQNYYMPEWFTLRATKYSKGDALKMGNYFYESKLFVYSETEQIKIPVE